MSYRLSFALPLKTLSFFMLFSLFSLMAQAGEVNNQTITITDKGFEPSTLILPAGKKIPLIVKNTRQLPSEFESYPLNREKIVPAGRQIRIWVGPLSPGEYAFFDDLNPGFKGQIVVKKDLQDKSNAK
jgi:hypothetical protein